jgi:hypothetical protein
MPDTDTDTSFSALTSGAVLIAMGLVAVLDRVGVPLQVSATLSGAFVIGLLFVAGLSARTMRIDHFAAPQSLRPVPVAAAAVTLAWVAGLTLQAPGIAGLPFWIGSAAACLLAGFTGWPVGDGVPRRSIGVLSGVGLLALGAPMLVPATAGLQELLRCGPIAASVCVGLLLVAVLIVAGLRGPIRMAEATAVLAGFTVAVVVWRAQAMPPAAAGRAGVAAIVLLAAALLCGPPLLRLRSAVAGRDGWIAMAGAAAAILALGTLAPWLGDAAAAGAVAPDILRLALHATAAAASLTAGALVLLCAGLGFGFEALPPRWGQPTSARFARLRLMIALSVVTALAADLLRPDLARFAQAAAPGLLVVAVAPALVLPRTARLGGLPCLAAVWTGTLIFAVLELARRGVVPLDTARYVPAWSGIEIVLALAAGLGAALLVASVRRRPAPEPAPA